MHSLHYEPAQTARPNTFWVRRVGSLWRLDLVIRTTDVLRVVHCQAWAQANEPRVTRRRDAEGMPVLIVSRTGESSSTLEAARLHPALPMMPLHLLGWAPPNE